MTDKELHDDLIIKRIVSKKLIAIGKVPTDKLVDQILAKLKTLIEVAPDAV